jgi:hypothetical protein
MNGKTSCVLAYAQGSFVGLLFPVVLYWRQRDGVSLHDPFYQTDSVSHELQGVLVCVCLEKNGEVPSSEHLVCFLKSYAFNRVFAELHKRLIQFSSHIWADPYHSQVLLRFSHINHLPAICLGTLKNIILHPSSICSFGFA